MDELTAREREVLELVAAGLSNQEIGDRLGLAEKTIKHYMTNILGKLHVRSRVEAALLAAREGPPHSGGWRALSVRLVPQRLVSRRSTDWRQEAALWRESAASG